MRERDPSVTAASISRVLHCSPQRVRQVLAELGLPTLPPVEYDPTCTVCHLPAEKCRCGAISADHAEFGGAVVARHYRTRATQQREPRVDAPAPTG